MIEWLIIIGIILLLLAIFFAMPVLGLGLILPGIGDLIDVPLAFVCGLLGLVFITFGLSLGVVVWLLTTFWYVWLIVAVFLLLLFTGKITWGIKRVRSR